MGLGDFFKKMFSSTPSSGDEGIYFYVKLDRTGEIVQIRLSPRQDLVPDYNKGTYFSRKSITGPETFARAEAIFYFDEGKSFVNAEIDGGSVVEKEEYDAQHQNREGPKTDTDPGN